MLIFTSPPLERKVLFNAVTKKGCAFFFLFLLFFFPPEPRPTGAVGLACENVQLCLSRTVFPPIGLEEFTSTSLMDLPLFIWSRVSVFSSLYSDLHAPAHFSFRSQTDKPQRIFCPLLQLYVKYIIRTYILFHKFTFFSRRLILTDSSECVELLHLDDYWQTPHFLRASRNLSIQTGMET